jgi:peptidoglycan/xylan/chitin deacetylase (PgdA/CDA1 family)
MAIRPLAVSVVLAAALVGMNVMHDGGAAVLDGPIRSAAPSASPEAVAPSTAPTPGASGGQVPGPTATPRPATSTGTGTRPPVTAADRFQAWDHGPRTGKVVALTFDDGWNLKGVQEVVKILKAKQAPATFFPVARAVARHPMTWRSIAAAGFPIANHSWNHGNLARMSAKKAAADIQRSTRLIERIIRMPLFPVLRPPGGSLDSTLMRVARESGMRAVVMWDVDTRDWTGRRARAVYRSTLDATRGSIILLHTDKANTVKALPRIIDSLRKRGYTLVTVGQLIGLPGSVPVFMPREQQGSTQGR